MLASHRRRVVTAILFAVVLAAALPGSASAAAGDIILRECHTDNGTGGACIDDGQVGTAFDVAISPDGRHAYASSWITPGGFGGGGRLTIYDRNPVTGALTERSGDSNCYRDTPTGADCTDVESMKNPLDVLVSADGQHVYVTAWGSNGIAIFNRDASTGQLTQKASPNGCIRVGGDGTTCKAGRALQTVIGLFPSADGKNIYATAQTGGGAIAILSVNSNGELSQQQNIDGCVTESGDDGGGNACTNGQQIGTGFQLAVAPDGAHVYGASKPKRDNAVQPRPCHGWPDAKE